MTMTTTIDDYELWLWNGNGYVADELLFIYIPIWLVGWMSESDTDDIQ